MYKIYLVVLVSPQWKQLKCWVCFSKLPLLLKVSCVLVLSLQVKSMNSSSSSTCANDSTCWDRAGDADICSVVNLPISTPENLYLMGKHCCAMSLYCVCSDDWNSFGRFRVYACVFAGMDLFEEALRRWEEALTFRSRQGEDDTSCASVKTGAGDAIAEQSMEVSRQKYTQHSKLEIPFDWTFLPLDKITAQHQLESRCINSIFGLCTLLYTRGRQRRVDIYITHTNNLWIV